MSKIIRMDDIYCRMGNMNVGDIFCLDRKEIGSGRCALASAQALAGDFKRGLLVRENENWITLGRTGARLVSPSKYRPTVWGRL